MTRRTLDVCSARGHRLLHLPGPRMERAIERVQARRVARLRDGVHDPHRGLGVADGADRLRAGAPSSIRVGTGVVPIYTRTPATMAQTAATIDKLSGGRLTLGLGVSHRPWWRVGTARRSTLRWPRCASTPRSCARSCVARTRRPARSGARAFTSSVSIRAPDADLRRGALPGDVAPGRRDRGRGDAVAVLPFLHPRRGDPRGERGPRTGGRDAGGL